MYRDDILSEVNGWIHSLMEEESVPDEKTIRHMCKHAFVRKHYGVNPSSVRSNIPSSVRHGIRELVANREH